MDEPVVCKAKGSNYFYILIVNILPDPQTAWQSESNMR